MEIQEDKRCSFHWYTFCSATMARFIQVLYWTLIRQGHCWISMNVEEGCPGRGEGGCWWVWGDRVLVKWQAKTFLDCTRNLKCHWSSTWQSPDTVGKAHEQAHLCRLIECGIAGYGFAQSPSLRSERCRGTPKKTSYFWHATGDRAIALKIEVSTRSTFFSTTESVNVVEGLLQCSLPPTRTYWLHGADNLWFLPWFAAVRFHQLL